MAYAEGTTVPAERTRLEIEQLITKFVGDKGRRGVGFENGCAIIYFEKDTWAVQMKVRMPTSEEAAKIKNPLGRYRGPASPAQQAAWLEQQTKERWRQLLLVLKAKFTAYEHQIETFEQLFMAHLVVGGQHVGEQLLPALKRIAATGRETPLQLTAGTMP
jgi:hypothetical protein